MASMPFELTTAFRYLAMVRKRRHTAFLALISTLGLAVGVAALLISIALLSGLQGQIKGRMMAASPNLLIEPKGRHTIEHPAAIVAQAKRQGLNTVVPVISGIAWGSNRKEGTGRPAQIRSFDAVGRPQARGSPGLRSGTSVQNDPSGVSVTRNFAGALGLTLGDEITIVAPRTRLTPFGPAPVWKNYVITAVVPLTEDEKAFDVQLPFDEAANIFDTEGLPTSMEIYSTARSDFDAAQRSMTERFPSVIVKTWKDINRPLFLALRLEKMVMFATISLIIFVAALNLISSLSMLIVEKRPQVGVLRTLGASERSILMIFAGLGLLIGLIGTVAGNVIGLGFAWVADRYQLIPLPGEMYYLAHIPFAIDWPDVVVVNAVAVVLCTIATWYPARIASRLDPITAIHED